MTFYMIYIFIQSECLFELKTEYFALIFLHIPYEEMCISPLPVLSIYHISL